MKHKNYKSSKIQLFFFTVAPNILVYVAIIFFFLPFSWANTATLLFAVIGVLWSLIGGFVCAANKSLISAIGAPKKPVINIEIGAEKIKATAGKEYSSSQMGHLYANIFFAVIFAVPVALFGWLLFLLYCKGVFLKKTRAMFNDLDTVEDMLLKRPHDVNEIAYYFYRMLDYTEVYKQLNERSGANKMLEKADSLLELWRESV